MFLAASLFGWTKRLQPITYFFNKDVYISKAECHHSLTGVTYAKDSDAKCLISRSVSQYVWCSLRISVAFTLSDTRPRLTTVSVDSCTYMSRTHMCNHDTVMPLIHTICGRKKKLAHLLTFWGLKMARDSVGCSLSTSYSGVPIWLITNELMN